MPGPGEVAGWAAAQDHEPASSRSWAREASAAWKYLYLRGGGRTVEAQ